MNDREKVLVAAVAVLVALWGATQGWDKYQAALERNLTTQRNVAQDLSDARTATARGRRAQQKLRQWQRQSLPTDADIAKSLYQDWLQQQLTAAGLQVKDLSVRTPRTSSANYRQFTFVANATGELEQLTDFLYRFYQARHLHRISKATLTPSEDRKSLTISLTVDALSLAEASREDQLAEGTSDLIKQPRNVLQDSIATRNIFATYQPQSQVADADATKTDAEAAQARISGINYGEAGWQMSVRMEKSGHIHYFREGDTIEIGQFKGTIEQLDGDRRQVIVASGPQRLLVRLGQTLAEAQPFSENAS